MPFQSYPVTGMTGNWLYMAGSQWLSIGWMYLVYVVHRVGLSQIEHQVSIKCRLTELVYGLIEVVYGLDRVGLWIDRGCLWS